MPAAGFELVKGKKGACYYLDKEEVPILEVEVNKPVSLTTEYRWVL